MPHLFATLTSIVILFQLCLAAGLPWGIASMGGKFPGKYPPAMRVVAVLNAAVLAGAILVVWSRAGLGLETWRSFSVVAIWVLAVLFFAGTVMNAISPSRIERVWSPVALVQCICCVLVGLS
jgi:putative copper export protein